MGEIMRRMIAIVLALQITICCPAILVASPAEAGQFKMTVLEMEDTGRGYGLAIILQTPAGHTYLYDTGVGYPSNDDPSGWVRGINTGKDQILPFLNANHITQIEGVVISHAHFDHFGGLMWLTDHFPIKKLYDSGYEFPEETSDEWREELGAYTKVRQKFKDRSAYQEVHSGDHLQWDESLEVEVLAPPKTYFSERRHERSAAVDPPAHYLVNANSVELRIRHDEVVFVFPGDIQKEDQEQSMLPVVAASKLRADILIAAGHGSNSCQSPKFAEESKPKVVIASIVPRALASCSAPEVYGPFGAHVYVTAERGWIQVVSDGKRYSVSTERLAEIHGVAIPATEEDFMPEGIR
jgi:competence protein ComEC